MAFKLQGIAVDRMTVSAEEDVLSSQVMTENPLSDEAPTVEEENAALKAELAEKDAQLAAKDEELAELKANQ